MSLRQGLTAFFLFALVACGGGTTSETSTTTSAPTIQISGSVTTYRWDPQGSGAFGDVSYIVTNRSNQAVVGCFVRVNWLDSSGLQVGFNFAATDAAIPAGTSTFTDQDFMETAEAVRIVNSRVEYSNCR
jgi:hypothetical protein